MNAVRGMAVFCLAALGAWGQGHAAAEEVSIPDPVLAAHLRELAGMPEGPLEVEDLAVVERVALYNKGVADLAGLEHCANLTSLFLFENDVRQIDNLANMPQLREVTISRNPIADLSPLAKLPALTSLGLQGVPAEDLSPLAECTTLRYLDVSGIRNLDLRVVAELSQLEQLVITASDVGDLEPLSALPALRVLKANRNAITNLAPLQSLDKLEDLYLDDNQIGSLAPLADLPALRRLYVRRNQLTDVTGIPVLHGEAIVLLSENQIEDIQPLVAACAGTAAAVIELGHNQLGFEAFCSGFHELEARGNQIYFRVEEPHEDSTRFPDPYALCEAREHAEGDLYLAAVNRGAGAEELARRFGDTAGVAAQGEEIVAASIAEPTVARGPSAALDVEVADTRVNLSVDSGGINLTGLLIAAAVIALAVVAVVLSRIPRRT